MTVSVKVHVNGNYRATCKSIRADGSEAGDPIVVNHGEEKHLPHYHGEEMTYKIVEEQVADKSA